jgi:hypothetical protein
MRYHRVTVTVSKVHACWPEDSTYWNPYRQLIPCVLSGMLEINSWEGLIHLLKTANVIQWSL